MKILGQFIKDLSFENIAARESKQGTGSPNIEVKINLDASKRTQDDPFLRTYLKALDSHPAELEEMSKLDNIIYKFDVRKYESETETLDAVKELYDILDLPGYNREYLAKYWNHWANKIDEIAN